VLMFRFFAAAADSQKLNCRQSARLTSVLELTILVFGGHDTVRMEQGSRYNAVSREI
jgi:hypothetical protein